MAAVCRVPRSYRPRQVSLHRFSLRVDRAPGAGGRGTSRLPVGHVPFTARDYGPGVAVTVGVRPNTGTGGGRSTPLRLAGWTAAVATALAALLGVTVGA